MLLLFLVQSTAYPINAEELDYNFDELMSIYDEQSIIGDKVVVEHKLTRAEYDGYLDEYSLLEDGVEQLNEVMTVLDMMINQTVEKANNAGPHDEEILIIPLDEFQGMSGGSNIDQNDVEVVEVIYGEEIKVKLAIDSHTYYMEMVLPELMNQLGEVKLTYDQLVEDQQLDIYVEMETLKVLTDNLDHIEAQAELQEQNNFEELLYAYTLNLQQLKVLEQQYILLESEYKDEQEKNSLGLATLTEVSEKQNKLLVLEEEKTKFENDIEKQYNTIVYGLKLEPTKSYAFNVEIQESEVKESLAYEEFASIVKSQSMDLLTIHEQIGLYDDMQGLAEQVYRQDEEALQIITLTHAMKDLEYNKLLSLFDVLIMNTYNEYQASCDTFKTSKQVMAAADEEYTNLMEKHQIGLLSDREYDQVTVTYNQEKLAYTQAILDYNQALNTYVEALNGTVDSSALEAN